MLSVFIRSTLGPLLTPPDLRGRVGAVERVFIGGSNELGAFESGAAAALIGAVPAVAIGGILAIGAAALLGLALPATAGRSTASRTRSRSRARRLSRVENWFQSREAFAGLESPTATCGDPGAGPGLAEAAVDVVQVHRSAASSKNVRRMRAPAGFAERYDSGWNCVPHQPRSSLAIACTRQRSLEARILKSPGSAVSSSK